MSSNAGGEAKLSTQPFRLCMVRSFLFLDTYIVTTNRSPTKDTSAFLIIVYSTRRRRMMSFPGMQSVLNNILQGSTSYFLVIFTGHVLLILFQLFAAGSIPPRLASLRSLGTAYRRRSSFFQRGELSSWILR